MAAAPVASRSRRVGLAGRLVSPATLLILLAGGGLALLERWFPPPLQRVHATSPLVLDGQGELLRGFTTAEGAWRLPLPPGAVDPLYLNMLKAYEDQRFERHFGVDPLALARALAQWGASGRVISGASTLTMQAARLLEPRPRTLSGKLLEMLRAVQLEWRFSKDEILALYLNLAPYGGNLQGLRAAALAYLGKEPLGLTPAEAALLVALPQAPSRLRPDRFPERARAARDKVLARLGRLGVLTPRQAAEAAAEPVPAGRHGMPFHAPHLARRLRLAEPDREVHRTFIDGPLQRTLEMLARRQPLGAHASLAFLVVENRRRRVLAYVGSADFFDVAGAGQVDMAQAVRSPGSTLKPLIYGMGFDDLIIHPETLIDDVPTPFGDYRPANFRHVYGGQVSVREALQRSLNVPAVAVLDRLGPGRVAARLQEAGLVLHWGKAHPEPGLPLVLGGVGITLADLVALYAGIADGGVIAPLRFSAAEPPGQERRLLSEAACWYLRRILEEAEAPEVRVPLGNTRQPRPIAHKTGTSYGFRDAWALGFDRDYTVGVWVGRPDGSSSPERYGRNTAAPLLFRIFELLPAGGPPAPPPKGVLTAAHGDLPERWRYFSMRSPGQGTDINPLRIDFPVNGATVELAVRDGGLEPLPLAAQGGRKPLRWLVNGRPLASSPLRREARWIPDGEGLARITIIDGEGRTANAEVWIKGGG